MFFSAKSGVAEVDDRGIEQLSAGVELWQPLRGSNRGFFRFGVTHQHELPGDAIESDPAGTLLGFGDGIRHRGGLGGAFGIQVPFRSHRAGDFFVGLEATLDRVVGSAGPDWYWGGGASVGFSYELGKSKKRK